LVYQSTQDPLLRAGADIQLVEGISALTFTDSEAALYGGFATLGILLQLAAGGVVLQDEKAIVEEAIGNVEAGLAAVPGEAMSLHGAFHVLEHQFLDLLHV
jgi:hypothetical protein